MAQAAAVNYYNHHLGDYDAATAHLTWDEDLAYSRLLRAYYRTERPIPLDEKAACRLVRAHSKSAKAAVARVLNEFFERRDDGWHNKRADEEIVLAREKGELSAERKENERERQRRHRERRKSLFDQLRQHGQVPPWDTTTDALERMLATCTSRAGHAPVTSDITDPQRLTNSQSQYPIASNHGDGVDVSGLSKAVESPVDKKIEKTPEALRSLQNPAWLFSFDHAKLHARKLGIHIAGKTHQELKDAIAERMKQPASPEHQPKFAQSQ